SPSGGSATSPHRTTRAGASVSRSIRVSSGWSAAYQTNGSSVSVMAGHSTADRHKRARRYVLRLGILTGMPMNAVADEHVDFSRVQEALAQFRDLGGPEFVAEMIGLL